MNPLLELRDVAFRYRPDAPWAVDHISLQVAPGEVLGLLGPNGAGKSTLLALIAGLRRPAHGRIERPPAPRFALVPQDNAFYPMLTCRENLEFFAGVVGLARAARRARVDACVETAALQAFATRRAEHCSGGVKRRLNFAIGLLSDPDLLLLDEPTVNVDTQARAFLLDLVRGLRVRGKAIVYASHYMEEVEAVCDRIAIVDGGRVIAQGRLHALLTGGAPGATDPPDGRRLRVYVRGSAPQPPGPLPWQQAQDGAWSVLLPAAASPAAALAQLETAGLVVERVTLGERNLEDLFLRLTQRSLRD